MRYEAAFAMVWLKATTICLTSLRNVLDRLKAILPLLQTRHRCAPRRNFVKPTIAILEDRTLPATLSISGTVHAMVGPYSSMVDAAALFAGNASITLVDPDPGHQGDDGGAQALAMNPAHVFGFDAYLQAWDNYSHGLSITGNTMIKVNPSAGEHAGDAVDVQLSCIVNSQSTNGHPDPSLTNLAYTVTSNGTTLFSTGTAHANPIIHASVGATISFAFQFSGAGAGTPVASVYDSADNHFIVYLSATRAPDLIAKSLKWDTKQGGVNFQYAILKKDLPKSQRVPVSFYWADGNNPVGQPLYTTKIHGKAGMVSMIHVPARLLTNLPYSVDPIKLLANRLLAVIDPVNTLNTLTELGSKNKIQSLALRQVVVKPAFQTAIGNVQLNQTLLANFMKFSSHLIGRNLTTGNITLNDGVRDPAVAHRWSTSWSIRNGRVPLKALQALPDGKDLDGNLWYDKSWETGLPTNKAGHLTAKGLALLWKKIKANALRLDNRSTPNLVAAEGYLPGDPHRAPNTYSGSSKHCQGLAIDATVPWRAGGTDGSFTVRDGSNNDPAANRVVRKFGLSRPVPSERHHFELT